MENKLVKCFDELVNTLNKYDRYQLGDEVDIDLLNLQQVINEVTKRLAVIETINENINSTIRKYQECVDSKFPFIMEVDNYDTILNSTNDIEILTDLDDSQPIEENWGGVFKVVKTIDEKLHEFYLELDKEETDFYYDSRSGTCHVSSVMEIKFDCTPFWEGAEGISMVQYHNGEYLSSFIIPFKKPTHEEMDLFKDFYRIQVQMMVNSLYK